MRFDKTFIAIRERGVLEIFDLALHVVVAHFKPLLCLLLIGTLPWIALDYYLIGWMATGDVVDPSLYYWLMLMLVVSQAQVGTTFMTRYLAQAMFEGQPSVGATIKEKIPLYFFWSHGVLRCVLLVLLLCFSLSSEGGFEWTATVGFLFVPALVILGLFVRAFRPFASEILLLERTPVSGKDPSVICFAKRSASLHGSGFSDLFGRMVTAFIFTIPLAFSCYAFFAVLDSILNIQANMEMTLYPFYWIVSLWTVAGFICVVRFLSYIDIRIRQEGWAVELRMRAEGQRLLRGFD